MKTTYFDYNIKGFVPIQGETIDGNYVIVGREIDKDGNVINQGTAFKVYTDEEREVFWAQNTGGGIGVDTDGISPKWLPKPTKTAEQVQAEYENAVNAKIREKYTLSQELAILRQQTEKPEEYAEYYAYCEQCKTTARAEIYGGETQ